MKVKKIGLYTLASIAMVGAAVCAGFAVTAATPMLFGAMIPLAVASGAVIWYARTLIDYQDPAILSRIRAEAPNSSLPELLKKHGWDNLYYYQILETIAFESSYRAHADILSFNQIVSLFYEAQSAIGKARSRSSQFRDANYFIPSPGDWKNKFAQETKDLSCAQILDRYPLKDLKAFEIVSPKEQVVLERASVAVREFRECERNLEQRFFHETSQARSDLFRSSGFARLQCCLTGCREIDRAPPEEVRWMKEFTQERYKTLWNRCMILSRIADERCTLSEADLADIGRLESWLEGSFWLRSQPAYRASQGLRDSALRAAQAQFDRGTKPKRMEIDALQSENQVRCEQKMAQIDADYRQP